MRDLSDQAMHLVLADRCAQGFQALVQGRQGQVRCGLLGLGTQGREALVGQQQMGCVVKTVERKLKRIRSKWEGRE